MALQQQLSDGTWGERVFPEARFLPTNAIVDQWLDSSTVTLHEADAPYADTDVRVSMRRMSDRRSEASLLYRDDDGGWSRHPGPVGRYVSADSIAGRWLISSPIDIALRGANAGSDQQYVDHADDADGVTMLVDGAWGDDSLIDIALRDAASERVDGVSGIVVPTETPHVAGPCPSSLNLPFNSVAILYIEPRTYVFSADELGESVQLTTHYICNSGDSGAVPSNAPEVIFTSTDPAVVTVSPSGLVTAVAPGGVDIVVSFDGATNDTAPFIVYGPVRPLPPYDPARLVAVSPVLSVVVNRVIAGLEGESYDSAIAHAIAEEYGGAVVHEWTNTRTVMFEFDHITDINDLTALMESMADDPRVLTVTSHTLSGVSAMTALRTVAQWASPFGIPPLLAIAVIASTAITAIAIFVGLRRRS